MSTFITIGNHTIKKDNIVSFKTENYPKAVPGHIFQIIVYTNDVKRSYSIPFNSEEERKKALDTLNNELK
jgi:hypothetical protein